MTRTKLDDFMHANRIRPRDILTRTPLKRGILDAVRSGRTAGSAATMSQIRAACTDVLGRDVAIEELFSFVITTGKSAAEEPSTSASTTITN